MRNKGALCTILLLMLICLAGCSGEGIQKSEQKDKVQQSKPEEEISDEQNEIQQMFPDKSFTSLNRNAFRTDDGETYYIESIQYGPFIKNSDSILVTVRRSSDELSHAQGFYNAYVAVFDKESNKMLTSVLPLSADGGTIHVFEGQKDNYLYFSGNRTYQGYTTWEGGLYKIGENWEMVWPKDSSFWEGRAVQIGQDRIFLYTIKDNKPTFDKELYWNPQQETFTEKPFYPFELDSR